jgi:beta-mannosidase
VNLAGSHGELRVEAVVRPLGTTKIVAARLVAKGPTGEHTCDVNLAVLSYTHVRLVGQLRIDNVATWIPHTHGVPNLYSISIHVTLAGGMEVRIHDVPAGFRTIGQGKFCGDASQGPMIVVSGVPIFCRGMIWTPVNPISLNAPASEVRGRLAVLRDAGMNIVRVPGNSIWEDDAFHNACDELGILVWQDLMLARMDYPTEDSEFAALLTQEVRTELARVGRHASTAVICGGSEVEQQAAMLGLPPGIGRTSFVCKVLPMIAAELCSGIPVLPSSPCGGDLPFRLSTGVSHYFGVGAYLRPLTDARTAGVRFASACLAFANIPEQRLLDTIARIDPESASPGSAGWKRGVPRDAGMSWDFEDVRDHYLRLMYGVEPGELRRANPQFYLDLSRQLTGEIMATTVGEWRRAASPCAGAIILQAADLIPGCGWGVLDAEGMAKPALAILRRVCLPRAVWTTDEGLDGIDIHVANDSLEAFECTLRVALYRYDGIRVEEAARDIVVSAREVVRFGVEELLGRFIDANWAYRFGPRDHEVIVASVHIGTDDIPSLQHFQRVGPISLRRESYETLGLRGTAEWHGEELHALVVASRPTWGVRIYAPGFVSDDSWFALEPGRPRRLVLRPLENGAIEPLVSISALNASGNGVVEVARRAT